MKYNLNLEVALTKEYKGIEAEDRNEAEIKAIELFRKEHPGLNLDIDTAYAKFFK